METKITECVLEINLNRGPVNAMDMNFFSTLESVLQKANSDNGVRAVVIYSSLSSFFTAGLDLKSLTLGSSTSDPSRLSLIFQNHIIQYQNAITSIERCRKPVIAAIHGYCIGGGIDLITACDIRVCSKETVYSVREVDIGIAADIGTLQRLPRVIGNDSWVREVCLTGRNFDAKEAFEQGLVSRVYDSPALLIEGARGIARLIASKAPLATLGTKHLLVHSRDRTVQEGLDYTLLWSSIMIQSPDFLIAVDAAMKKKKAVYGKL